MISMRMKKFYKKTGRKLQFDAKEPVGFDKTKVECYNCHKTGHFARECRTKGNQDSKRRDAWNSGNKDGRRSGKQEDSKALVTIDGECVDWTSHSEEEEDNALMACNSLGSDIEVTSYSKECLLSRRNACCTPPMTGNYMPSGPDIEIDYSQFTYGPKQSQPSESETQTSDFDTCESNCSDETHESLPEPAVIEPKVVSQPKVCLMLLYEEQRQKTPRETVKNQFTHSKNPKVDKKGLGYGFVTKACFVCGSLSHLIRDCDFHEKRMAKQAELNNRMRKKSSQREIRTIWNNVQRVNHKNQFVPTAVLTRTGKILVNTARASGTNNVSTARHNFKSQAVLTNAARKISTVKPFVNRDYPHRTLQNKGIVDSGCSRHMTGNKAYLAEYQDFNGGPVAFRGSKGYITGKGIKREYSNARTPQQNGVAERKNRTLIEGNRDNLALFDLDYLNDSNELSTCDSEKEAESAQDYFILPIWSSYSLTIKRSTSKDEGRTAAIQDSKSLDSCRFALWEEGNWNKIGENWMRRFIVLNTSGFIESYVSKKSLQSSESSLWFYTKLPESRYLKGKPKLSYWYHRVSSFDLEAYSDNDYAGGNLDRKSTLEVVDSWQ
ncbi:ribonuclease H-like domain-containing protein [Tanacetum coccineum]